VCFENRQQKEELRIQDGTIPAALKKEAKKAGFMQKRKMEMLFLMK
jgi:hypothetical protein